MKKKKDMVVMGFVEIKRVVVDIWWKEVREVWG